MYFTKISNTQKQNPPNLGDKNSQDTYLSGLITVLNVQRKQTTTGVGIEKN